MEATSNCAAGAPRASSSAPSSLVCSGERREVERLRRRRCGVVSPHYASHGNSAGPHGGCCRCYCGCCRCRSPIVLGCRIGRPQRIHDRRSNDDRTVRLGHHRGCGYDCGDGNPGHDCASQLPDRLPPCTQRQLKLAIRVGEPRAEFVLRRVMGEPCHLRRSRVRLRISIRQGARWCCPRPISRRRGEPRPQILPTDSCWPSWTVPSDLRSARNVHRRRKCWPVDRQTVAGSEIDCRGS